MVDLNVQKYMKTDQISACGSKKIGQVLFHLYRKSVILNTAIKQKDC